MLMPIQLPYVLVIAHDLEIQIRNESKVLGTTRLAVNIVASPLDIRPRVDGCSQQRQVVLEDVVRQPGQFLAKRRVLEACTNRFGSWKTEISGNELLWDTGRNHTDFQV